MLVFYTCTTTTASKQRNLFADNFYEQKEISLQTTSTSKTSQGWCVSSPWRIPPSQNISVSRLVGWCALMSIQRWYINDIYILHRNILFSYYVQLINCQKLTNVDSASTHDGGWTLRWQHRHIQPPGKRNHMCEHWTSMLLWSFSVKGKKWFGMLSRSLLN